MKTPIHVHSKKTAFVRSLTSILCAVGVLSCATARAQTTTGLPIIGVHSTNGGIGLDLRWTGPGNLESAPTPTGPWTTVQGSTSYSGSATQSATGAAGFFRLRNGARPGTVVPSLPIPALPPIASATIQRLATPTSQGDTILEVVFQQSGGSSTISRSNFFTVDDDVYMMRDDGVYPDAVANDGIQTAIVPLSTNDLAAWNSHVDELAAVGQLNQPIFTSRAITGSNTLSKFDLLAFSSGIKIPLLPFPCSMGASTAYDWRKTILITDLSVVEDTNRTFEVCGPVGTQMGHWTFGYLMSNICNQAVTGINPVDFTKHWLNNWEFDETVNFDKVSNRSNAIISKVISQWVADSGGGTNLNLGIAPFRLLAIANRLDLRSHVFPYDNAGECRFVFCAVDRHSPCASLPFTVIFEFGVPKHGCAGIKGWAAQWAALNAMPFGPAFNAALQAITDQVTAAGSDPSKLPNMSAINQIRSNEILDGILWDLREFTLDAAGFLDEHTVKNTPAPLFNNSATLTTYGNDATHIPDILLDNDTVPLNYLTLPFLGAHAFAPFGTVWDGNPAGSIVNPNVRIHLSLNTCSGCHTGETLTAFTHVNPRVPGTVSGLSGFLTGITVPDPKGFAITNRYADLDRRVADLDMVIHKPCVCLSLLRPITMPH